MSENHEQTIHQCEDVVSKTFEKINFHETTEISAFKNEIEKYCNEHHIAQKPYLYADKIDISQITPYLKDTDFAPIASYFGYDTESIWYGKLVLYAVTDNTLYRIVFKTKSVHGNASSANRIDSIEPYHVYINDDNKVILYEKTETEQYGFGALWCPCPSVETKEQINLYNLQKSLRSWSVANKINEKLRRQAKNKPKGK